MPVNSTKLYARATYLLIVALIHILPLLGIYPNAWIRAAALALLALCIIDLVAYASKLRDYELAQVKSRGL